MAEKNDDDRVFRFKTKAKLIGEMQDIINLGLEEFYTLKAN